MGAEPRSTGVERIVSGGQTGVDRGALEAAIVLGIPHGGWCPLARRAEDGRIPERYQLTQTGSAEYSVRTGQNVRESDATLILCRGPISGGTDLARRLAATYSKPCLVIDLAAPAPPDDLRRWLAEHEVEVLNVAGPRESQCPGIQLQAEEFLKRVLAG